jgi:hypothetical protein
LKTFEDQIKDTIRFWCWRLNDHRRSADLEQACWLRVIRPETWTKLQEIWENPDPEYGGVRGVSRFLSDLCTNAFLDEQRRRSAGKRIPEKCLVSLSDLVPSKNPEDPETGDTLEDYVTGDKGGGYQAFLLADLRDGLTSEEFRIINEILAGYSVRELAARLNYPRNTTARIRSAVIAKVKSQIEQLRCKPRPALVTIPLLSRATYRPDRISRENLEAWSGGPNVTLFHVCDHASGNGDLYQDFTLPGATQGTGRYGLCRACWFYYWRKLTKQLERDMFRLADEIGSAALGTPK